MDGLSVIICCYNSADRLFDTLKALSNQTLLSDIDWEIIIVNNNSKDNTVNVCISACKQLNINNYRIIDEPKPGLSNARKAGVQTSRFNFLVFCDDDNWLCPDYLSIVHKAFEDIPSAGILGGWSEPAFPENATIPDWFNQIRGCMAIGGRPDQSIVEVDFVWGAGMAIRRDLAKQVFNEGLTLSDREGNNLVAGGDVEICEKVKEKGYKIFKLLNLKFFHFVPSERLIWEYLLRLNKGFGYSAIEKYYETLQCKKKIVPGYLVYTIKMIFKYPKPFFKFITSKSGDESVLRFHNISGAWSFIFQKIFKEIN